MGVHYGKGFGGMRAKVRRKMKRQYTVRKTAFAKFLDTTAGKVTFWSVICAAAVGVICLMVFVAAPAIKKAVNPPEKVPIKLNDFKDSLETENSAEISEASVSYLQKEALIDVSRVNDPFIYKNEIIFSSAEVTGGVVNYSALYIYDIDQQTTEKVSGIEVKYNNILSPMLNDDYIVFLDSAANGGGRICVYDRKTRIQTAIKDYLYAAPQVAMDGNLIAFMQQAGEDLDRLYLFDLDTFESTAYRIFSGLPAVPSAVDMQNGVMVYSIPYQTEDGYNRSRVYTMDLATGIERSNEPGKLASYIRTNGKESAFLSAISGAPTELYLLEGVTPVLIDSGVGNFEIEENYIVYTKGENVYIYTLQNKQISKLNSDISRGLLTCANDNMICWYDVTGGYSGRADIVRYAEVDF